MKVKEKSEKAGLKFNIQKTKIMASSPQHSMANRWENNGNSERLFFQAPKSLQIVAVAMKLKDTCFLEEKAMTNLDSILKSRGINFPTNAHLVKAMVFPACMEKHTAVLHGWESWTIKKAEH